MRHPLPSPEAVIFDLDGTLLDTIDDLADSMNHVLESYGFPPHPVASYTHFIGNGMPKLVERALPESERTDKKIAVHTQRFRESYSKRWNVKTKPYPGIENLLDHLASLSIPMGVCSNKPDQFTQKCISELLPDWKFDCVLGHREDFPRKPDPASTLHIAKQLNANPSNTWFVGDSGVDMQTASAAGMIAIGVLWGFRSEEELRENGAQHVVSESEELMLEV